MKKHLPLIMLLFTLLVTANYSYANALTIAYEQKKLKSLIEELQLQFEEMEFVYNPNSFEGLLVNDFIIQRSSSLKANLDNLEKVAPISYLVDGHTVALKRVDMPVKVQEYQIKGIVSDEQQIPIPGATIVIQGTNRGTSTDMEGHFSITSNTFPTTIEISYLGYNTLTRTFTETPLEVQSFIMTTSMEALNEVVVTGQGADVRKKRLPTQVTTIKGEDLEKISSQRIDQQLSAQLPNAQINLTGGQAGATSIIRARGVNSAFLNSTPIIYLDGVRLDNLNTRATLGGSSQGSSMSAIADIPMDNIEKIEYINGGAATTLYGSDAANGVIQIFTKKGGKMGTHVSVMAESGIETPTADFLYFDRSKDLLFRNGLYQKYNLNLNGRSSTDFGYNFSASFMNSSGVQIHDQNENMKADFSTGFKAKIADNFDYESSFIYVHNQYKRNRNGNQGGYTGLWFAEDGASKITGPGFNNRLDELSEEEFEEMKAFVDNAERLQDNQIIVNRFTTSQSFKYKPIESLMLKFTGGLDYRAQEQTVVQTNEYLTATRGQEITDQGSIQNIQRNYLGITLEFTAQHTYNTGDFSFISTVGGQLFRNKDHQILYSGTNIRDGALTISDAAVKDSDEFLSEVLNYGIYAQENIGYKDKLFLDLGIRGDRNPAFGDNIGTQFYPKAGASYMMSQESWFNTNLISSLRFRGSFGIAGNLPPAYANEKTIVFDGYLGNQAAAFGQPGNENLKPEKTHTIEGGVDIAFLRNRVNLSAGYYRSLTKDALFYIPSSPSSGYTVSQLQNIGEIENYGLEFSVQVTPIQTDNISLSFNASVNTLHNEVLDAGGAPAFNLNGFSARTLQTVVQEGYPIGFIRGNYGTFDENGVLEETIPQSYLGTTIPDLFGNIGMNFSYKDFNLFANGSYQSGGYGANWDAQFRYYYGAAEGNIPQGEIDANGRANWLNFTNRFVEKTDFLKIRTIGASYTFRPGNSKAFDYIILGITAVNPFNFTASSFDPEATISGAAQGQGGASTGGISYATYSAPRQFLTSLKINF
ncbi:TonB-dependent receptor domain-containing protein [Robertkochia solimangrovi]|uniref:TonB-dependent receptor domain-containing protein n=1 Tax=Robertkochia solimangrovi TaxID=2213046 RepID=UPI00117D58DD|nr:TonB-dependent receptor [Robertkochia solimangrovi]TRZ43535.1 TonB-dependent receptor [Robertkochia solimangrovi]